MTTPPRLCSPQTTVAAAAELMWEGDCGVLPVADDGRLVGIVTDRDMYMALATRNRLPSDLLVGEVMTSAVHTCAPEDSVERALQTMAAHRVRRLPVLDAQGIVVGLLSLTDLARASRKEVSAAALLGAVQGVSTRRATAPQGAAA